MKPTQLSILCISFILSFTSCQQQAEVQDEAQPETVNIIHYPQEKHLANVRQLTFGGDNAEAYFSFDNSMLVFQRTYPEAGVLCDQIFYGKIPSGDEGFDFKRVSSGLGRTTCAYFLPGDTSVLYASTYRADFACPEVPDRKQIGKYVWPIYPGYDIYVSTLDGEIVSQLTESGYYDAEATVSPSGDKIVFTSTRNGDLDLYVMDIDGKNVKRLTDELGYDGGAFFSPDGSKIVFRASRPETEEDIKEYKDFLSQNLVAPTEMEIFVCNVDGSDMRQITHLGKANWAPYFHPSGEKILFSSNHHSERGFQFNIFMINIDGTGLQQITYDNTFDAFPMFSHDGKYLVFSSNRNNGGTRDTNVFIAEWVE